MSLLTSLQDSDIQRVCQQFLSSKDDAEELELKLTHPYFYQVHSQMFTCGVEYCDFVVCTFSAVDGIFVERIVCDEQFGPGVWHQQLFS